MTETVLDNNKLEAALEYLRKRWSAFPCNGKEPLISWKEFQKRLPTEEEVCSWWKKWPHANIGLIMGAVSGGLAVLDVDKVELAEELIRKRGIESVATLVRTPRKGLHIYLQESKGQSRSGPLISGVADLKAEGGYVVAPPSEGYEFISEKQPLPVSDALAEAWNILGTVGLSRPASKVQVNLSQGDGMIEEGNRNTTLASIAGSLRRRGIDSETIRVALEAVNQGRCRPPLPSEEVLTIARSIGKYPPDPNSIPASKDPELARIESWTPRPITELPEGIIVEWDWEGYIPSRGISLLTGLWKSGKTTLLSHLLKAKCTGGVLIGQSVSRGKVLVISEESFALWRRRLEDLELKEQIHLMIRPFKGKPTRGVWEEFIDHVTGLIRREDYSLVVVDSLATHWSVNDENNASEVTQALTPLYRWTECRASVLLIHHPRKGDATEGQASRGSGALTALPDVIIEFRRYEAKDRGDRRRVLTTYSRYDESPPELVLDMMEDGYVVVGTKGETARADRQKEILELLHQELPGLNAKKIREDWSGDGQRPGIRTLEGDLKFLLDQGRVMRDGEGKKGSPYLYRRVNSIPASPTSYMRETNSSKGDDTQ